MSSQDLIPHLFRTEYSKLIAVLCKAFGLANMQVAEDIVGDTFLLASESWGMKGLPENPTAWLYTVAKNKTRDYLKRENTYQQRVQPAAAAEEEQAEEMSLDLSDQNINDSQLQMMFALCEPKLPAEAQVGLALRILCGFGIDEIADAFLSKKETINKRLFRAKEKLRSSGKNLAMPPADELPKRLDKVLTIIYLLFNEGYYSLSQNHGLRKELCIEAMRLCYQLLGYPPTCLPKVNALMALMCFHASRFDARIDSQGDLVLYERQHRELWSEELIQKGSHYLNAAAVGNAASKYHFEAAIAYWHTRPEESQERWERILQLYNQLLQLEYSPIIALNRTYSLAMVKGKKAALKEAKKIDLDKNHLYHSLLATLYEGENDQRCIEHLKQALSLCRTDMERRLLEKRLQGMA